MFRAIKRLFISLGLMAEKATETDAINAAVVERGIRDRKPALTKRPKPTASSRRKAPCSKSSSKNRSARNRKCKVCCRQRRRRTTKKTARITPKSSRRSSRTSRTKRAVGKSRKGFTNKTQRSSRRALREIQKFERDFAQTKARVAVSRQLESLAGLMKSSVSELQGMLGGEMGQSMQQLRESAAKGEGQMRATMDMTRELGSGIARQQEMRKARGKHLFDEYKKKMGMVQPEAAAPSRRRRRLSGRRSRSKAGLMVTTGQ